LSKNQPLLAGVLASWLGFASPVTTVAQETQQSNWTSADASCAKYDDLRKPVLGNIGVKIDASLAWADAFRRALSFWNTVLAANFHEETNLETCAVRIVDGSAGILSNAIVARSQMTEWVNFRGKIAVSPIATKEMSSAEMYAASVHEFGHMLGLKHSTNSHSVMYFLDVNGTEVLDAKDILALSTHHKLRSAIASTRFLPIQIVQPKAALKPELSSLLMSGERENK
jgi:Matrixin